MKIGIVGAGIMGRAFALACLNAGWQVQLFDKNSDAQSNCSMAAAGLLMPYSELDKADALINTLGIAACTVYWPRLLAQLQSTIYFNLHGSITLCHPRESAELQQFMQTITHKLPDAPYQKINHAALTTLEPALHKFNEAYYCPGEGNLDNQGLLQELKNYLVQHDVIWKYEADVTDLGAQYIQLGKEKIDFDIVADCRGLGAKNIFTDLQGIRGELIWLHAPDVHLTRPLRFLHPRYSLYIAPRPNQHYIIGASEIYSEDYSKISVRTMLELLTAAFYVHPGFAEARIIKSVTHCRPATPDYLPQIRYTDGFLAVNGLYRHGFLLAPTLAQEMVTHLQQQDISYPALWEKMH